MSTMLATVNPDAAKMVGKIDMPKVGWWVRYHFRPMEIVAGMTSAPALVLARDLDNNVIRLLVVLDRDDMRREDRVPRRVGEERGWEYIDAPAEAAGATAKLVEDAANRANLAMERADAAHDRLESFMGELSDVFFGEQPKPEIALLDQFKTLSDRVDKLEKAKAPRK